MNREHYKPTTARYLVCALALIGCASTERTQAPSQGEQPDWISNAPAGCGVGIAKHRGDSNMARTTAIARARADLAQSLEIRVQAMIKDYQSQGEDAGNEFSEERVVQVSRQLTDKSLAGSKVVANYLSQDDSHELYTMVCIETQAFGDLLREMNSLSPQAREALRLRAEAEFTDMHEHLNSE